MIILLSVLAFLTFCLAICGYIIRRPRGLGLLPSDFFVFFFVITWSPSTFIGLEYTHVYSYQISEEIQYRFAIAYILMTIGMFGPLLLYVRRISVPICYPLSHRISRFTVVCLVIGGACLVSGYLAMPGFRSYLGDVYGYLSGGNLFSYSDIRRSLHTQSMFIAQVFGRFQYSLIALIFALIVSFAVARPGRMLYLMPTAVVLFLVCAGGIKKMPYVYYLALAMAVTCLALRARGWPWKKLLILGGSGVGLIACLMVLLYAIQYRDVASVGRSTIMETLWFRITRAYPDGFKLYLAVYPEVFPHTLGTTNSFVRLFVQPRGMEPYIAVPSFFGNTTTTYPSGFVSYAYADFGFIGIFVLSVAVGLTVVLLNRSAFAFRSVEFRCGLIAFSGMATLWFWTMPFTTCLLTGGVGLAIGLATMCSYLRTRKSKHPSRRFVSEMKAEA